MAAVLFFALLAIQSQPAISPAATFMIVALLGVTLVVVTTAYVRTRKLAKELEQANRAKLQFLTTMSHELRTPLNAIAGYTDLLSLGLRGPVTTEQKEDLARIQRNQRQLLALINDVLNFAKLDVGNVLYSLSNVPVATTLRSAFLFIEPQVREKHIQYTQTFLDSVQESVAVHADEEKLYQIFVNLISNAVKFTPPNGAISVTCSRDADQIQVSITDTGIGIPPLKIAEIFDPFVQVDTSLTREHPGIGLGLSISRHLAIGMHGNLVVESTLRKGSTFTLTLPIAVSVNPSDEAALRDTYTLPDRSTLQARV